MDQVRVGRHIVIVGAGYGGVVAASLLARKAKKFKDLHVTLVNPSRCQESRAELDMVIARDSDTDFCNIDLEQLYEDTSVELVFGRMHTIDRENRTISVVMTNTGETRELFYDHLILGVGAKPVFPPVPGLKTFATPIWGVGDVETFKARAEQRFELTRDITDPYERRKLLTFTVVGAGATGVEVVGPFAQSVQKVAHEYGVLPEEVTIYLVDGLESVLNDLAPDLQKEAVARLHELGIELKLGSFVKEVTKDTIELHNGEIFHAGEILFAGGARVEDVVATWGLPTTRTGRLVTDKTLLVKGTNDIWAVGDCAAVPYEEHEEMPMLAQHAMRQGEIAATNVLSRLFGPGVLESYGGDMHGQFVSIGNGYAIGWAGAKSVKLKGKMGAAMKRMTYMMYWQKAGGLKLMQKRSAQARALGEDSHIQ